MYRGPKDPSHFTAEKITEAEVHRVCGVLKQVYGVPELQETFNIKNPPSEVGLSSRLV